PALLMGLIGGSGVLRSGSSKGVSFALESPVGTVLITDRPVFHWAALSGAKSYMVSIYDTGFNRIMSSGPLSKTAWTASSPLKRGEIYAWKVTADKDGQEITSPMLPAPEAMFKILEKTKAEELDRNKQALSSSHLAAGVVYAQNGMLDDAEAEFQ